MGDTTNDTNTTGGHGERGEIGREQRTSAIEAIWAAMINALRSATHLQVVTVYGEAEVTLENGLDKSKVVLPKATAEAPQHVLATNIDLALGDITQTLSPKLMDGAQEPVLKLHNEMLDKGQKIVEDNLRLLKELAKELRPGGSAGS